MVPTKVQRKLVIPVARKALAGIEAEKFVERMLRVMMKVPSSERALLWRKFILNQPAFLRKRFIAIRQKRARIRKEIRNGVVSAVNEVRKNFPEFKGVLFFGSLAEAREKGHKHYDLDVVPILEGTKVGILHPDAYDLLAKSVLANTGVELDGVKTYLSHKGGLRESLFSLDISSPAKAREQLELIKSSGFSKPKGVFFASYNFFGDEETRKKLEKIVD